MSGQSQNQMKIMWRSYAVSEQAGLLQRKCACGQHTIANGECEACRQKREGTIQRAALNAAPANGLPSIVHEVLSSSGRPLDVGTRAFMEPRFGHDFSGVRVHTDNRAAESAQSVNALAYTVGRDVVFGTGQYAPGTGEGRRLMAHELTHVVQQENSGQKIIQRKDAEKSGGTTAGVKSTPSTADADPCRGESKAKSYKPTDKDGTGKELTVSLGPDAFGDTSKLAAYFHFGACKVEDKWRFYLDRLIVPIASAVKPVDFKINVDTAGDSAVTKDTYRAIVDDLRPNRRVKMSVSCAGNKFDNDVASYSRRRQYWKHKLVVEHEAFHRRDWDQKYRSELIQAEKEVWGYSLPASKASTAQDAVSQADKTTLTQYMIDAYQRTCKTYAPEQETRAYDAGAKDYQDLVDAIQSRSVKEKWEQGQ